MLNDRFTFNFDSNRQLSVYIKTDEQDLMRLFNHLISTEALWYDRLNNGTYKQLPVWPDWSMDKTIRQMNENEEIYMSFLKQHLPEKSSTKVTYTNTQGNSFSNTFKEILEHVLLHGMYHRGQINHRLRLNGRDPLLLDFIHYRRSGF